MSSIPRTQEELDRAINRATSASPWRDLAGLLVSLAGLALVPIVLSAAVSYWTWAWNLIP